MNCSFSLMNCSMEGISPPHSVDASNQIDFPTLQDARAQSNRSQQADLAFNTPHSSPCSPQASILTAAGSHLSPPLMEKLEADLVLLQKKYGLISQALTPSRIPHQDARSVQADMLSSKQAAMGTFVSPLRQNKVTPPMALGTEAPLAILAKDSSYHNHFPPPLSNTSSQISNCSLTVQGNAPLNPTFQSLEIPQFTNRPELVRIFAAPSVPNCSVVPPTVHGNCSIVAPTVHGNVPQNVTPIVRGNVPPNVRGNGPTNVPPNVRGIAPPSVLGIHRVSVRGNTPPFATLTAQNCTVFAQNCTEPDRGNAPLYNSATQCTEPVRGTSWAARLGGSRSTSSTPLSYFPPTLVAGRR